MRSAMDFNRAIIDFFRAELGITTPMFWASELGVEGKKTSLLLDICQKIGASTYISGPDGAKYIEMDLFTQAGVEVVFHSFKPPVYDCKHYLPALSTLDILMNVGPEAAKVIGIR